MLTEKCRLMNLIKLCPIGVGQARKSSQKNIIKRALLRLFARADFLDFKPMTLLAFRMPDVRV